jgi:hypothetical protein
MPLLGQPPGGWLLVLDRPVIGAPWPSYDSSGWACGCGSFGGLVRPKRSMALSLERFSPPSWGLGHGRLLGLSPNRDTGASGPQRATDKTDKLVGLSAKPGPCRAPTVG